MADLDKQIRLRVTEDEKSHMDTAAKDAGYGTLSDYLRHVLFDQHVLVVDGTANFTLVPAWSADAAERDSALLNVEGVLALGRAAQEMAEIVEAPQPEQPFTMPEFLEQARLEPGVPGLTEQLVAGTLIPDPDPAEVAVPPLAAAPPAPPSPAVLGPTPLPDETGDVFVVRRARELQVTEGQSPLSAQMIAEAEWRATLPGAPVDVSPAPDPRQQPSTGHGFCAQCGTPSSGTPFCASCGAAA